MMMMMMMKSKKNLIPRLDYKHYWGRNAHGLFISYTCGISVVSFLTIFAYRMLTYQGCGNTIPNLSDLVPFHSGQAREISIIGPVRDKYKGM